MNSNFITTSLFALLIFLPALLRGGRSDLALFFFFAVLIFYLFLRRDRRHPWVTWILAAWLLWIIIQTLFFSVIPYTSLKLLLPLAGAAILFFAGVDWDRREPIVIVIVAGALLLVSIGLIFFVQSQSFGYLRLISTFFQHNAFAGFLILPIILSLWLFFEEEKWGYVLWATAVVFLLTGFFLTFSRGGFLSLGAALLVFFIFLWRACQSPRAFVMRCGLILFLITISALFAYSIFYAKRLEAETSGSSLAAPYSHELSGETGITSRLVYMKYAAELFRERPFIGFGLGAFATEARRIQDDVRFFSTDPHNLYLRFAAELGGIGGILFFLFLGGVIFQACRYSLAHPHDLLFSAFFAGFSGMLIHNGGDVDFQFPANIFLFFAAAAVLVSPGSRNISESVRTRLGLSVGAAVLAAVALASLLGSYFGNRADYKQAIRFDPFNPFLKIAYAVDAFQKQDFTKAEVLLKEAEALHPYERRIFLLKATLLRQRGERAAAEAAYKTALELAPFRDLEAVMGLVNVYLEERKIDEAIRIAQAALERFPQKAFESPFWVDPEKENIRNAYQGLRQFVEDSPRSRKE